jgi:lysophospholipase L1-like esterase
VAAVLGVVLLLAACGVPGEPPPPANYVALGDSFSSGDGAGGYDATPADCRRSSSAWPRLLDQSSASLVVDLRACSGADTGDLVAQLPPTPNEAITLVTLTIGGNDAGFGDIVEACLLGSCPSPTDPAFLSDLDAMAAALGGVYTTVDQRFPSADILHVGYPRLTPPPGDPVGVCFWLPPTDQAAAAAIVDAINDRIEAAVTASSTDVAYVDVTSALADHELCTPSPWVTLLGRAHPNAAGQQALRQAVAAAL